MLPAGRQKDGDRESIGAVSGGRGARPAFMRQGANSRHMSRSRGRECPLPLREHFRVVCPSFRPLQGLPRQKSKNSQGLARFQPMPRQ